MLKWGIIADDNTGATDAAGMLTERGARTLLIMNENDLAHPPVALDAFQAVVIGTQNRSVAPELAAAATSRAVSLLRDLGVGQIQIKYCSTFDSTREGNIGPTLDAALGALPLARASIVCPALVVNGRTVYQGHLFVGRKLLSESALRNHPLNPMTDANLVRWLQYQTDRKVELVPLETVRGPDLGQKLEQLVDAGAVWLVTDAVCQDDLDRIAMAVRGWPLISGGSGITAALPAAHGCQTKPLDFSKRLQAMPRATLVVSGSQSPTSARQTQHAEAHDFKKLTLDIPAIVQGTYDPANVLDLAEAALNQAGGALVQAPSMDRAGIERIQQMGADQGLNSVRTGERIADTLAGIAGTLVERGAVGRLIVAGGETSGAVCRKLDIRAVEVGLPLAPGVPYCFPTDRENLLLVLKSGNFGQEALYQFVRDELR